MLKRLIIVTCLLSWQSPFQAHADDTELTELLAAQEAGFSRIAGTIGNWTIAVHPWDSEAGQWSAAAEPSQQGTLTIEPLDHKKGLFLAFETNFSNAQGYLSFDPWRQTYRMATIDDVIGLVDVEEGRFSGDQLVLDNAASDTTFTYEREHYYTQTILTFEKGQLVNLTIFNKKEGESNWTPNARFDLTALNNDTAKPE